MDFSIYGLSGDALNVSEQRAAVLTENIANSATPHYKARDLDFQQALKHAHIQSNLKVTNPRHIAPNIVRDADLVYRIPMQQSSDGNTVDEEIERKNFIQNALEYQIHLTFIQNKTNEILKALKGE